MPATNKYMVRKNNPSYSELHVSRPLTNMSIAHWNVNGYVASRIFPPVGVMKKSDSFYVYTAADLRLSQAKHRAPGTPSESGKYRVSTSPYTCERWAIHRKVSDPERDNADPQFNLDAEATEFVTDQIGLAEENEWAGSFFAVTTWNGGSGGSGVDQTGVAAAPAANQFLQWNDLASLPIEVIRGEKFAVHAATGLVPNQLILGPNTWKRLLDHPDIVDRIKHTMGPAIVTEQIVAQLLGLRDVIVLGGVINSAADGAAASTSFIAGNHALLLYTAPNPGLRTATAGVSFVWTGGRTPLRGARIKRIRDDINESDLIEGERWQTFTQTSADLGAFMASAVAS